MMKLMPFDKTGPFYRGSLHSHTTASDGERTPERLLKMYAANGYDFVCITDHFLSEFHFPITVPEKPLSGLTVIPSAELARRQNLQWMDVAHDCEWFTSGL